MNTYADHIAHATKCGATDAATVEYLMRTFDPGRGVLDDLSPRAFAGAARRCYSLLTESYPDAKDESMRLVIVADARKNASVA